jgi:glycosyltransferase involved in cell wall biosynthesis
MACGCPVIASDLATLREVISDAGVLVGPTDVAGFAEAIRELTHSEAKHAALSNAARKRATMFSWDRCAQETLETYRAASASSKPAMAVRRLLD